MRVVEIFKNVILMILLLLAIYTFTTFSGEERVDSVGYDQCRIAIFFLAVAYALLQVAFCALADSQDQKIINLLTLVTTKESSD